MSGNVRNAISGTVAIVLIGLAVFFFTRGGQRLSPPSGKTVWGVDLETGKEIRQEYPPGDVDPYVNPATGKHTVYPWYFCMNCNMRFVPALVKDDQGVVRVPPFPTCVKCGGSANKWFPPDPDQANPKETAPLPKLPK